MSKKAIPYKLPDSWTWTIVGKVGIIASGGTPSTRNNEFWEGDVSWVTPADLSNSKEKFISRGARNISLQGLNYSSAKLLPEGSILFSSRAPIGYVAIAKNDIATNQGFKNVIPTDSLFSDYIYYYFKTIKQLAENVASGTTFLDLSLAKFGQIPVPLAPLNEQKRIVAKIEELFSELDQSTEDLLAAQKQLKLFRQLLLKNAFEGLLSKKWREEHKPVASKLILAEVKNKIAKAYQNDLTNYDKQIIKWKKAGEGPRPVKPRLKKQVPSISNEELNNLPKLPTEWHWQRIGDIAPDITVGYVGSMKEEYISKGIPFLRSQNVRENYFDNKGMTHISRFFHKRIQKSKIVPGDILIVRSGNVGVSCVLPEDIKEANCSDLVIIKKSHYFNSKFISYYLNSLTKTRIQEKKVGVALTHFNTHSVEEFPIPLVSIEEQNVIIQELESAFSIIENLELAIIQGFQKTETFRHSILKKAFQGELVDQDSSEENATELLKRIQEEKELYLQLRKEANKLLPKKMKMMKNEKSIIELLGEHKKPVSTKELWRKSKYKDDIEPFYAELKKIETKVTISFKGNESFITLAK